MALLLLFNSMMFLKLILVYFSSNQIRADHVIDQSLSQASGDYGNCPNVCWNGNFCGDDRCKGCFFKCPDEKCRKRQTSCERSCYTSSDCSSDARCRGCVFCRNVEESCSIATFEDDRNIFDVNDSLYWNQWLHSGQPYFHAGAPVFFDVNDDNKLDYFNPMHGHPKILNEFKNRMELGLGTLVGDRLSISDYSERFVCTDVDCDNTMIDMHGSVVMDLNGDGISDIYISNGGGGSNIVRDDKSLNFDNWLFWGEKQIDLESGKEITVFRGGREAARMANLDMQLGRGRFNYIFDANNDGLLDVFSAQDSRVSNKLRPGVLLVNQGNNSWKEDEGMKEYSRTMILTDADGDGYARELIINRAFCYPARPGPDVDPSRPELGPYSTEVKQFCSTRPVGTPVIYRYSESMKSMEQISKQYKNFWAREKFTNSCCPNGSPSSSGDCNAISIVSGDFDDDQIADQIFLYSSKMLFFFSSDRQRGTLPDSSNYIGLQIKLPAYCDSANSMQLVDLDNDGKEEILVSCKNVGLYLLYTKGLRKIDWTLNNGCNGKGALGDLSNRFNHLPSKSVMRKFCNEFDSVKWGTGNTICRNFSEDRRLDFTTADALSVVDINNDGFRDIVATSSFGHLRFFINKPTAKSLNNRFIGFRFIGDINGSKSNAYGIGATVILVAADRNGDTVKQFREISSAQHHTDMNGSKDDRMVFGLGTNLTPKRLVVRWSNGFEQIIRLHDWTFKNVLKPIDIVDTKHLTEIRWSNLKSIEGYCLNIDEENDDVNILPCLTDTEGMQWRMNHKGTIFSKKYPKHCLFAKPLGNKSVVGNGSKLGITSSCNNKSWLFTKDQKLRYGGSRFRLNVSDLLSEPVVRLGPLYGQRRANRSKWFFDAIEDVTAEDFYAIYSHIWDETFSKDFNRSSFEDSTTIYDQWMIEKNPL